MSFSFGTPSSAPATTGLSGSFSFGANKPATPGFGLTATSQPSTGLFGSTPASSAPAFGSTSAFGSTTPAFGTSSVAPTFGSTTTPAFGASSAAPAFGTTTTPAFGATSAGFGATTTPAFGATTSASSFGTGLGTGGLNFGTGSTTAPNTGLTFGAPATTANTGLGGLGGFGFGTSTQANTGLFGATSTAQPGGLFAAKIGTNTTGAQLPTSAAPSLGLGGLSQSTGIGATTSTTTGDGKGEPPKQTKLPNELLTTVDSFKEFVKKQKGLSSEVMRISIKPLHKVSQEAEAQLRSALALGAELARARAGARRLRGAAVRALNVAERAAGEPAGELEGSPPPAYVNELIADLEKQLITFRRQMDVADKQMQAEPKLLTEQELTLGIRRMHESLVALAGRLQAVHAAVEAQKEQYLNLRKYILKDPTDVFGDNSSSSSLDQILHDAEGSKKKAKTSIADYSFNSAVLSDPRAALSSVQQLAGPTPFTYLGSTMSPFPTADITNTSWQPTTQTNLNTSLNTSFGVSAESGTGFQLQKPPGKRGKQ